MVCCFVLSFLPVPAAACQAVSMSGPAAYAQAAAWRSPTPLARPTVQDPAAQGQPAAAAAATAHVAGIITNSVQERCTCKHEICLIGLKRSSLQFCCGS
jgi:hypothetical protein